MKIKTRNQEERAAFVAELDAMLADELPQHGFEYKFDRRFGDHAFVLWSSKYDTPTKTFRDPGLAAATAFAYIEGVVEGHRHGVRKGTADHQRALRESLMGMMGLETKEDGTVINPFI